MKRSTFITWDQLKVGVVIVTALAILTVAVTRLGTALKLFEQKYTLYTFLPNASGLRIGGQVTVAGQLAGTVKRIDFLPVDNDTTRNLRVTLEVNEELQAHIRGDSEARLRTLGLLGDKVVDVTPGTSRADVLAEGDTLPMGQSLDYEQVIAQASGAVGDMVQLTRDLKQITGGIVRGEGALGQIVTNRALYDELTGTLSQSNRLIARLQNPNGTVGRMLDDPTLYTNLARVTGSVDSLVVALRSPTGTPGRLLSDTLLYASIISMAQNADSLTKLLSQGNGTASQLLRDQQLYDQLVKATTDLNAILADVRRDPRRYLQGVIKVF